MITDLHEYFLLFVRLGIGHAETSGTIDNVNWVQLKALADGQGLSAVVLDGLDKLNDTSFLQELKLEWIGEVLQMEATYKLHQEVATDMANLFHRNAIRTYVLKGRVISECYPKPNHRVSVDMDCYLLPAQGEFDAWRLGNDLINETFNTACSLIEGLEAYSQYVSNNPGLEPYLRGLINVVQKIKDKTQKISISLLGRDLSFELVINIIKERQKDLFTEVLNMKNTDNTIGEMSIAMQSLENILTSLN